MQCTAYAVCGTRIAVCACLCYIAHILQVVVDLVFQPAGKNPSVSFRFGNGKYQAKLERATLIWRLHWTFIDNTVNAIEEIQISDGSGHELVAFSGEIEKVYESVARWHLFATPLDEQLIQKICNRGK